MKIKIIIVAVLCLFTQISFAGYPYVNIHNKTDQTVTGIVHYDDTWDLCSDDNYSVKPYQTWTATSRGLCLVVDISASAPGYLSNDYVSSGTSYAHFSITKSKSQGNWWLDVTRP